MQKHISKNELGRKLTARRSQLAAKKSLGQHFLTSKSYLRAIVDALELPELRSLEAGSKIAAREAPVVVEIGPGKGSLTAELLSRGARVIALEKDHRLIPLLEERFSSEIASDQLRVIESDALEFDARRSQLTARSYAVVGNIPYYITGALLQKFLTDAVQPSTIVFLVQKEVAERIARSKKESLLSLSVKAYGTPKYVKTVPAGAFSPPPKVDSAILQISNISQNNFISTEHEKQFFELIHAGFAHKRKQLGRNLESLLEKNYSNILQNVGISPTARAEDVPLVSWLNLAKKMPPFF